VSSVSSGNTLFSICSSCTACGYRNIVKGLIAYVYVVVSDILVTEQGRLYLVLSEFASRPV